MFQALTAAQISELVEQSVRNEFEPGATLATENDVTNYLIVVASGVLSVNARDTHGNLREIDKLGPGDSLGEAGVLAGAALHVTVVADTYVTVYKLEKSGLTPLLKSNPDVARKKCSLISKRRDAAEVVLQTQSLPEQGDGLFQRIWDGMRRFHVLGD